GRGDLQRRGDSGDQQGRSEYFEQERLALRAVDYGGDEPAVAQGHDEYDGDDGEGDADGFQPTEETDTAEYRRQNRQVQCHDQVLEHQHRHSDVCLAITESSEIADDLRDDAGGRDVGDTGHRQCSQWAPAE